MLSRTACAPCVRYQIEQHAGISAVCRRCDVCMSARPVENKTGTARQNIRNVRLPQPMHMETDGRAGCLKETLFTGVAMVRIAKPGER